MGENSLEIQLKVFERFIEKIAEKDGQGVHYQSYKPSHAEKLQRKVRSQLEREEYDGNAPSKNTLRDYFYTFQKEKEKYRKLSYSEKNLDALSLFIGYKSYYEFCGDIKSELGLENLTTSSLIYNSGNRQKEDSDFLEKYLDLLIKSNQKIQLPSLGTKLSIPLEQVYVSLRVEGKVTSYERESAYKNFEREYKKRIAELDGEPTIQDEIEIQADLLRENPTMRSFFQEDQVTSLSSLDVDQLSTEEFNITLAEAFRRYRYLVILGAPGSGKSTLAKWLAIQLARALKAFLSDQSKDRVFVPAHQVNVFENRPQEDEIDIGPVRLPLLIKIPEYAAVYKENKLPLVDYLAKNSLTDVLEKFGLDIKEEILSNYMKKGKAVVILDGLDEVPSGLKPKIQQEIQTFIDTWIVTNGDLSNKEVDLDIPGEVGGNQIIVTSRIVGYQNYNFSGDIVEVTIQEMEQKAVRHFCDIWMREVHLIENKSNDELQALAIARKEANDLKEAIYDEQKPTVQDLAANPLLVTFLAIIFRNNGSLPENRIDLYNKAYEILVHKWRVVPLNRTELDQVLPVIAHHIHQSPSDYITKGEFEKRVEEGLFQTRGNTFLLKDVQEFSSVIKDDVGLIAEDGPDLFKFLHRTFQEYLAGKFLVSDDQEAANNILNKLSDPVWREPILLSLGHIDKTWPDEKKEALMKQLLHADDPLKDLVPRAALFIALALGEMEKVSDTVVKDILDELISIYNQNRNRYQYQALNEQIERAFKSIFRGAKKEVFLSQMVNYIDREDLVSAACYLISKNQWVNGEIMKRLQHKIHLDREEDAFPIDQLLRSHICHSEASYRNEILNVLPFKYQLIRNPDLVDAITEDQGWLRLVVSLYGGLEDLQIAEKATHFGEIKRKLDQEIGTPEELHSIAIKLDTESGPLFQKLGTAPSFSPDYIYRDSPFTSKVLELLEDQEPSDAIHEYLEDFVFDATAEDHERSLALVGWLATGGNLSSALISLEEQGESQLLELFFKELERIKLALRDSLVRASHLFGYSKSPLRGDFFAQLVQTNGAMFMRELFEIFIKNESSPIDISYQIKEKRIATFDNLVDQAYCEAEGWAYRLSMHGDDSIYNNAVILDTAGKVLKKPFDVFLHSLANIHKAKNLKWKGHIGWQCEWLPPFPEKESQVVLNALNNIQGISDHYDFVKDWMFWSLGVYVEESSDLYPEILIRGLSNTNQDQIRTMLNGIELENQAELNAFLAQRALQVKDPMLRFRSLWRLMEYTSSLEWFVDSIKSFYSIEDPHDFVLASEVLLGNSDGSEFISGFIAIDQSQIEAGNVYPEVWGRAWERAALITHPENRIRAQIRLANLAGSTQSIDLIEIVSANWGRIDKRRRVELRSEISEFGHRQVVDAAMKAQIQKLVGFMNQDLNDDKSEAFSEIQQSLNTYKEIWVAISLYEKCKSLSERQGLRRNITNTRSEQEPELEKAIKAFVNDQRVTVSPETLQRIDRFLHEFGEDKLSYLAPYLEGRGVINLVHDLGPWRESSNQTKRLMASLLLAENGEINEEIVHGLMQHIKSSEDKLKNRAGISLHALNTGSDKLDRKWKVSKVGLETLLAINQNIDQLGKEKDVVNSTRLAWFFANLVFDDADVMRTLLALLQNSRKEAKLIGRLIQRIEMITPAVWEVFKEGFKTGEVNTQKCLFDAMCSMIHLSSPALISHFPYEVIEEVDEVIKDLPEDFFSKNVYRHYQTSSILQALEATADLELEEELDRVRCCDDHIRKISNVEVYRIRSMDHDDLIKKLAEIGGTGFVQTGKVIDHAREVANQVKDRPTSSSILFEWTVDKLREDLYSTRGDNLGATLCIALSEFGNLAPDQFIEIASGKDDIEELFLKVAQEHPHWVSRRGGITLISHLSHLNPRTISAFISGLNDVPFVLEGAMRSFSKCKRAIDAEGLELLIQNLKSNSALVASESAKLIAEVALSEDLPLQLRELAVAALSQELREARFNILPRQIWTIDKQNSRRARHEYRGDFERVLYGELIKVSGII